MPLWLVTVGRSTVRSLSLDGRPCPTIIAHGIGGSFHSEWFVQESDVDPTLGMTEREIRDECNRAARERGDK